MRDNRGRTLARIIREDIASAQSLVRSGLQIPIVGVGRAKEHFEPRPMAGADLRGANRHGGGDRPQGEKEYQGPRQKDGQPHGPSFPIRSEKGLLLPNPKSSFPSSDNPITPTPTNQDALVRESRISGSGPDRERGVLRRPNPRPTVVFCLKSSRF